MKVPFLRLLVTSCGFLLLSHIGLKATDSSQVAHNEKTTSEYYRFLLGDGRPEELQKAQLSMFLGMMPKGGDIHHHYMGALYAETYLTWVDKCGYCINKNTYRIESDSAKIAHQKRLPYDKRVILSVQAIESNDALYRKLLAHWSDLNYGHSGRVDFPPDQHFFNTFGYFAPVASLNYPAGLRWLKEQAIREHVQYIETMLADTPVLSKSDSAFDQRALFLASKSDPADLNNLLDGFYDVLSKNPELKNKINQYVELSKSISSGLDDANFTIRYQAYTTRNNPPSIVFSGLYSAFAAASKSPFIVGVNLVGPENGFIAMRDYGLHMQMLHYLKTKFPSIQLALHAGELTRGMVPPEGLANHIEQAIEIAGANRIGHGVDIATESHALTTLEKMRTQKIPVEINLTSNEFILGVKNQEHPIGIYRDQGVPFVISTDDPGVSRNDLTSQYLLYTQRYRPDYFMLKETVFNSIRYSFLSAEEKMHQLSRLKQQFESFEAQISNKWGKFQTASSAIRSDGTSAALFRHLEADDTQPQQFRHEPQKTAVFSEDREKCLSGISERSNQLKGRTFAF